MERIVKAVDVATYTGECSETEGCLIFDFKTLEGISYLCATSGKLSKLLNKHALLFHAENLFEVAIHVEITIEELNALSFPAKAKLEDLG